MTRTYTVDSAFSLLTVEFDKRSLLTRHSGGLTISLDDDVVPAPGWGEPVWSPWGPGHMGTTPGSHRDDTAATPWPKPRFADGRGGALGPAAHSWLATTC